MMIRYSGKHCFMHLESYPAFAFGEILLHLLWRADQQFVTHVRLRRVNRAGRQFQNAGTMPVNGSDPKAPKRFDQVYDTTAGIEIDQIDSKKHADGMNAP